MEVVNKLRRQRSAEQTFVEEFLRNSSGWIHSCKCNGNLVFDIKEGDFQKLSRKSLNNV